MPPYKEKFPAGTKVQVAGRDELLEFRNTWKLHHPLEEFQLKFAGTTAIVRGAGFYHGGDVLYSLEDVPGTWHEACLCAPPSEKQDL